MADRHLIQPVKDFSISTSGQRFPHHYIEVYFDVELSLLQNELKQSSYGPVWVRSAQKIYRMSDCSVDN